MRSPRPYLFVALSILLATGCSDSGTEADGITIGDFTGTWQASSHTFTNNADAGETFDLIANGGDTRVTVLSGGRARTWVTIGTFSDEWDAQLSINGNVLTSTPAEATRPVIHYVFSLVGDVLTLTNSDAEFDFTLSGGAEVPATQVVVLVRQ